MTTFAVAKGSHKQKFHRYYDLQRSSLGTKKKKKKKKSCCSDEVLACRPPRWPSGKASASRAGDPGFESRLRRDFFGVESYQ